MTVPCCKGTALQASVLAMQNERAYFAKALPVHLRHYLDEPILVSSWYPEADLRDILIALGDRYRDPNSGVDIFEAFGEISARRDVEGVLHEAEVNYKQSTGVYRNLVPTDLGVGLALRRSSLLWNAYHNTGNMRGMRVGPNQVRTVLEGFALPSEVVCKINLGYTRQLMRGLGFECEVTEQSCRVRGDRECAWLTTFAAHVDLSELGSAKL